MNSDRLFDKFRFDAPAEVTDDYGGVFAGWDQGPTVRAHLRNLRGSETVIGARLSGVQPVVITVRASNSTEIIETNWRAVDLRTGHVYNIRSVVRSDDRRWMEMTAERGVVV
jgi:head-tail adaptor